MQQLKLTDFGWHRDQPDISNMSASEMKAFLDAPAEMLMNKVNEIIGEDGATNLSKLSQRQETLEEKVVSFVTETQSPGTPEAVIAGASELVDKALSHDGQRVLRFLVSSDVHQKNDHELITKGTRELGQAMAEVLKMMKVDFVADLGDVAWGGAEDAPDKIADQIKAYKRLCSAFKGENAVYCRGNHDVASQEGTAVSLNVLDALLPSSNGQYYYMDFEKQKVRVIVLDTESEGVLSYEQLLWFATVALNMEGKNGWSVMTMSHKPLDCRADENAASVLKCFISHNIYMQDSTNAESIFADYRNIKCDYIGHFHGHTHSFSVVKMRPMGLIEMDAVQMGIPNACFTRSNESLGSGDERYATPETYHKEDLDGKRTSFNLVTVDLNSKVVYLDNYGAGIDRTVNYDFSDYTNQLPLATDEQGNIYEGKGYKENTYLSENTVQSKDGFVTTGFIPVPETVDRQGGQVVLYFSGITFQKNEFARITFYDAEKNHIGLASSKTFVDDFSDASSVDKVALWDENGNLKQLDISEPCYYFKRGTNQIIIKYIRLCAQHIDENSIITVNEEIV